jgi:hypothetical protein
MGWVAFIVVSIVVLLIIFLLVASFLLVGPRVMRVDLRESSASNFQNFEVVLTPSSSVVF